MSSNFFKSKKPLYHIEVGPFVCNFYFKEGSIIKSYLDIRSKLGAWGMKIDARYEVYGYLLAAAQQGMKDQIHGYCVTMYIASTQMTKDQGFVNDLQKAITKYMKRMEKESESEAKSVSEAQIAGDEALMREAIERGELRGDKKAEKEVSKAWKEAVKKVLDEDAKSNE